jgi:hypothetical protein
MRGVSPEQIVDPALGNHNFQMPKLRCIFSSDIDVHPATDAKGISLKVEIYSFPKQILKSQSIYPLSQDTRLEVGMEEAGGAAAIGLPAALRSMI